MSDSRAFARGDRVSHQFETQGRRVGTVIDTSDPDGVYVEWDTALSVDDEIWCMDSECLGLIDKFVLQTRGGQR